MNITYTNVMKGRLCTFKINDDTILTDSIVLNELRKRNIDTNKDLIIEERKWRITLQNGIPCNYTERRIDVYETI